MEGLRQIEPPRLAAGLRIKLQKPLPVFAEHLSPLRAVPDEQLNDKLVPLRRTGHNCFQSPLAHIIFLHRASFLEKIFSEIRKYPLSAFLLEDCSGPVGAADLENVTAFSGTYLNRLIRAVHDVIEYFPRLVVDLFWIACDLRKGPVRSAVRPGSLC